MRIYRLTKLGYRMARSVSLPDSGATRAIRYLDRVGNATGDQLAAQGVTAGDMAKLKRKPTMVEEVGGAGVPQARGDDDYGFWQ